MKNEELYFVKEKDNEKIIQAYSFYYVFTLIVCASLCIIGLCLGRGWKSLIFAVVCMISIIILFVMRRFIEVSGVYIGKDCIWYRDFVKRKIKPSKIVGIKVTKDSMLHTNKGFWGATYTVPRKDENGEYVYCMIFLKKLYDDMRTYNVHEEIFCMEYHECIMFKTVYDLPAINRLRELIPDLVVMYEEE